jgi:DNA polymerase/3'-5' exonuclease PolX
MSSANPSPVRKIKGIVKTRVKPVPVPVPVPVQVQVPVPVQVPELDDDLLGYPIIDLRKYAGNSTLDLNTRIIDILDRLIEYTIQLKASSSGSDKTSHQRRIASFIRARDAIKDYPKVITKGSQAQKEIEGVGKGIATRIQEFLDTGTLVELEKSITDEARIVTELTQITGIGEVKALSLIKDYGVTSVDDLISKYHKGIINVAKNQLTHHMEVGIRYYHDLRLRMQWKEADAIAKKLTDLISHFDPSLLVTVCGSYRRQKDTCGDIDVLITHRSITDDDKTPLPDIVTYLEKEGLLIGHLTSKGQTKYMGICRGTSDIGRRIDIRFVSYDSMGAATLYFTGSGKFNKIMRYHANTRGYTLNEYGLYRYINNVKGEKVSAPTEQDIFRILRFVYLDPTQREF